MQRLRTVPFVFLLIPLIAGILVGWYCTDLPVWTVYVLSTMVLVLLFTALIFSRIRWQLLTAVVFLVVLAVGEGLTTYKIEQTVFPYPEKESVWQIRLLTVPELRKKSVRCEAEVMLRLHADTVQPVNRRVVLSLQRDSAAEALLQGDILLLQTAVTIPRTNNPDDFRYDNFLRQQGMAGTAFCYSGAWQKLGNCPCNTLRAVAQRCQHTLVNTLREQGLDAKELAVVAALALGYRDELDTGTKQQFAGAGAMHVLAVSGLHVGIVYGILIWLLTGFGCFPIQYEQRKRRIVCMLVVIFGLWTYAFLTGMSPSVMRSALMFSLLCIANTIERESNTYNTIAASAFIALLINPLMLFGISFILSYSAVLSIVTLMPRFNTLVVVHWAPLRWIWNLAALSVAAQVGTLPWTLWWFGQTSNFFLLTNFVVVPAAGIIIYTVLFLLLLSSTIVAWIPATLLNAEVSVLTAVVERIESLPGAVSHPPLTLPMLVCLWGVFGCLIVAFVLRKWKPVFGAMVCTCLLLGAMLWQVRTTNATRQLIIWNNNNSNLLLCQQGRDCVLITDNPADALERTAMFRRRRFLRTPLIEDISEVSLYSFRYGESDFLMVRDTVLADKKLTRPLQIDCLLLGDIGRIGPERLTTMFQTNHMYLLPTMKSWKAKQTRNYLQDKHIPYSDIRLGAVVNDISATGK